MGFDDGGYCPQARREGLEVESIDNEVLVFDEAAQRVHCLNRAAALVWEYCDGTTPVATMAGKLGTDLGTTADDDVVAFALAQLAEQGLLEDAPALPRRGAGVTRRQLLARVGAAAVIIPVVSSMVAPTPAAAYSGGPGGETFTTTSVTGTITGVG